MIRNYYADCAVHTKDAQEFFNDQVYCICSQLKDILIKRHYRFLLCASAAVCASKLFVQPQKFQGCLRLIKLFGTTFFTYCNNFDCKAQMVFYFIKQD